MSKLLVGSATDVGLVRSINQDQALVAPGLYAVADGMGGHAAGEVASATAVTALRAAFEVSGQRSAGALLNAAKAANRAVWEQAQAHRAMHGMGTTLVVIAVVEREDGTNGLAVAHIGDSRAYLFRDGQLTQLTVDHSYVQELVDDGQISQAQAAVHPQRHVLTRALGVEPSVDVDLIAMDPRHGDRYLLCSDGLPREASDAEIAGVLERFTDPSRAAKELVDLANSLGGSDNITVVVLDVLPNGSTPEALITIPVPGEMPAPRQPKTDADGTAPRPERAQPEGGQLEGAQLDRAQLDRARPEGGQLEGGRVATATRPQLETGPELSGDNRDQPGTPLTAVSQGPPAGLEPPAPSRLVTWRLIGFVAAICFVIGGAIGALAWYARSAYFVSISHGKITVFQGRPGGVMWFQPTLAQRTPYTASSVPSYYLVALRAGQPEPSLAQAKLYITRMVEEKIEAEGVTPRSARGAPHAATRKSTPARKSPPTTKRGVPTTTAGRAKKAAP